MPYKKHIFFKNYNLISTLDEREGEEVAGELCTDDEEDFSGSRLLDFTIEGIINQINIQTKKQNRKAKREEIKQNKREVKGYKAVYRRYCYVARFRDPISTI